MPSLRNLYSTGLSRALFSGAGRAATGLTKRVANFAVAHPGITMATAAGAGLFATHPMQKMGAVIEDAVYGDPNAISKISLGKYNTFAQNMGIPLQIRSNPYERQRREALTGEIQEPLAPPSREYLQTATTRLSTNPRPTGMNPDGSLIFGLYNDRLR